MGDKILPEITNTSQHALKQAYLGSSQTSVMELFEKNS